MDLLELLSLDRIVELRSKDKPGVLREMVDAISSSGAVGNSAALLEAVEEREAILSTGIGYGVAVPHAKIPSIERFVAAIGISRDGIPYDSMDEEPVRIALLIAGPVGDNRSYLRILSRFTKVLRVSENRDAIIRASSPEEILQVFREGEIDLA